ncbi:MAG TPA: recombinase family protein [Ruminiclostridium sp.]|nr:recombinase family protein [Ruminiclostridium sp.]
MILYKRLLKKQGIRLISVLENLDDSPESVILESILEGMAEYYSKNLAREVRKGMNENALKAKHDGGIPPLGYDVTPDKGYALNQTEATTVKLVFDLYTQGYGYRKIIEKLNARALKTKTGKPFGKNSIAEILRNEKYIGRYVFNKRLNKGSNRQYKPDDEIKNKLLTDDQIDNIASMLMAEKQKKEAQKGAVLPELKKQYAALKNKMSKLYDLYEGGIDKESLKDKINIWQSEAE